jgi:hypothetical protein
MAASALARGLRCAAATRWRTSPALLAAGALSALSCGGDAGPSTSVVVRRDSAGVEIVESSAPAWTTENAWTLAAQPRLVIGQVEGEGPYLLSEVSGALRLDDGSIAIADGQSRELRFFDSAGTYLRTVGGPGDGPFEFPQSLFALERCGPDRIYAYDLYAQRIVAWSPSGEFLRSFRLVEPGGDRGPYAEACTGDGGFIVSGWGDPLTRPEPPTGDEALMFTQEAPVWLLDSLSAPLRELGTFVSSERIMVRNGSGPHPFGRSTRFTASNERTYLSTGVGLEARVYSPAGLVRIQRALTENLAIDQAFKDAYFAADLEGRAERDREMVTRAGSVFPAELPGFVALRSSPDGYLWGQRFVPPGTDTNRWGVFAPDGAFLGHIELPTGFRLFDVGRDYALGVAADELGVQRVYLYDIVRP